MRIDVTERRAKDMAKALKKALPETTSGTHEVNYQQSLDLVARTLGWKSFQTLLTALRADAGSEQGPALARADDDTLFAEMRRRGHVFLLTTHTDWIHSYYPQLSAQRVAEIADQLPEAVSTSDIPASFASIEHDFVHAQSADDDEDPPTPPAHPLDNPMDLAVRTFVVTDPVSEMRALAKAAMAADPTVHDVRFNLNRHDADSGARTFAHATSVAGDVATARLDPAAVRALAQASESEQVRAEAAALRAHGAGDNAVVAVFLPDGTGFLFLDDAPEAGYLAESGPAVMPDAYDAGGPGEGDAVGLLLDGPADPRPTGVEIVLAQTALARHWRYWLPRHSTPRPAYTRTIVAHLREVGAAPASGTAIDVTDAVLDLSQGPMHQIRRHLMGGRMRWSLRGAPADKVYDIDIRASAEDFFGKPVETLTPDDLLAARNARDSAPE